MTMVDVAWYALFLIKSTLWPLLIRHQSGFVATIALEYLSLYTRSNMFNKICINILSIIIIYRLYFENIRTVIL